MKDEYTEITAENADQFKGMDCEVMDNDEGVFYDAIIDKYILENWDHVRIKNVEEVEKERLTIDDCYSFAKTLEKYYPKLSYDECIQALEKASADKVEGDRWYLVEGKGGFLYSRYLERYGRNTFYWKETPQGNKLVDFDDYTIISPMIVEKDQGK